MEKAYSRMLHRIFTQNAFRKEGFFETLPKRDRSKVDLGPMKSLATRFGDPQREIKTIHIAGTNGKGSVALKTAKALEACGYKTGLFISPHISSFRERIQVNSELISEAEVVAFGEEIFKLKEEDALFFEIVTMMALLKFKEAKVDFAVLECGLGGRLDSTNICENVKAMAITSIGYDHTDVLGNTLGDIAREKAGIIKDACYGSNCALGPTCSTQELLPIFKQQAQQHNVSLKTITPKPTFAETNREVARNVVLSVLQEAGKAHLLELPTVQQSLDRNQPCRLELVQTPFLSAKYPRAKVFLDVCHNEQAFEAVFSQMKQFKKINLVVGFSKTKDLKGIVHLMSENQELLKSISPVSVPHRRLLQKEELAAELSEVTQIDPSEDVGRTLFELLEQDQDTVVLVGGSFYIMAAVRAALGYREPIDPPFVNSD